MEERKSATRVGRKDAVDSRFSLVIQDKALVRPLLDSIQKQKKKLAFDQPKDGIQATRTLIYWIWMFAKKGMYV